MGFDEPPSIPLMIRVHCLQQGTHRTIVIPQQSFSWKKNRKRGDFIIHHVLHLTLVPPKRPKSWAVTEYHPVKSSSMLRHCLHHSQKASWLFLSPHHARGTDSNFHNSHGCSGNNSITIFVGEERYRFNKALPNKDSWLYKFRIVKNHNYLRVQAKAALWFCKDHGNHIDHFQNVSIPRKASDLISYSTIL